ncbi:MAG: DNA translocase FtsK 4TM domain-containing protein [Rikenellaceae bacterium]
MKRSQRPASGAAAGGKRGAQQSNVEQSNRDSIRWVVGLIMGMIGLFVLVSILCYFFVWKSDFDLVTYSVSERPELEFRNVANICGPFGAWVAEQLVGKSFGLFGVVIPIFLISLGVRIALRKPLRLNRISILLLSLLFVGSTTLGFFLSDNFPIFHSGWGGAYGLEITEFIEGYIGFFGTFILVVVGWLLIGVFVNHNFIGAVNRVGKGVVDQGARFVNIVKRDRTTQSNGEVADSVAAEPQSDEPSVAEGVSEQSPFLDDGESGLDEGVDTAAILDGLDENSDAQSPVDGDDAETLEPQGAVITVVENELETVETDAPVDLYDPKLDLHSYEAPSPLLLTEYADTSRVTSEEILENKIKIEETLKHFGITIQNISATVGPTITLYEIIQAQGIKISKIQGLENDIAQSLKASGIRIIAPIPGRGTIGIEVPNRNMQIVSMYSSVKSTKFHDFKGELPIVIGSTIQNESYVFDLAKMPHLLVAGATGQGKSVGLNAIITSLLYRKHPAELKLVMIDPKMVEFMPYKGLEHHFLAKMESEDDAIITDPKKAVYTLNSLCEEMEKRLTLLSKCGARNIVEYNDKFKHRKVNPENGHFFMPYIVVIVDEFADLILMTREVEKPVMRLAQKARAVGIHLIIATQRPDVKVITGGIKANFPARIAFRVMQMIDSRTIIDQPGANQLIGRGDMLFSKDGVLSRIQCSLVETDEVNRIVSHIASQQGYTEPYQLPDFAPDGGEMEDFGGGDSGSAIKYDTLFGEIARVAVNNGTISTSFIQRNFEVGFNRAGRIMTQLERAGIVGRAEGAKPREILYHDLPSLEAKMQSLGVY